MTEDLQTGVDEAGRRAEQLAGVVTTAEQQCKKTEHLSAQSSAVAASMKRASAEMAATAGEHRAQIEQETEGLVVAWKDTRERIEAVDVASATVEDLESLRRQGAAGVYRARFRLAARGLRRFAAGWSRTGFP